MMKKFIFILILCASSVVYAKSNSIVGTWKLGKMFKQDEAGNWVDRCPSPSGLITYTKQGYMAVGINCMVTEQSDTPSSEMKDTIFYTGTYQVSGNIVTHHVQNSSDPIFYKKDLSRTIKFLDSDTITLTGAGKASQVQLIWTRIR